MAQERPDERTAERRWAVTHTLATVLLIVWNGVSNSRRLFPYTVGEVSDLYPSSFTPAGYAFAIWGPIYLGLLAMCGFGLRRAFSGAGGEASRRAFIAQLGAPFVGAQLACGLWLWAWLAAHGLEPDDRLFVRGGFTVPTGLDATREFSMVAVWALMAVFVRFLGDADFASVRWTALAAAVILLGSSITHGVRNFSWPPRG